jgi:hypothetical protein
MSDSTEVTTRKIILGSGKLFAIKYTSGPVPDEDTICKDENRLGHVSGGATLEYTVETYEAKDDLGEVSKRILTADNAIFKSGVMTVNGKTIEKLVATAESDEVDDRRVTMIGGISNVRDNRYAICFYNKDEKDGDTWITLVGQNTGALNLSFAKDKETVIDLEFTAEPAFENGRLVRFVESSMELG